MPKSKMNEFIEKGNYKQYTERDIDGAYEEYSNLAKNYPNHVEGFLLRGQIKAHYRYEYVDAKNDFKKARGTGLKKLRKKINLISHL